MESSQEATRPSPRALPPSTTAAPRVDVIGGVDTDGHTHHAAAISEANGKLLGDKEFPATAAGYRQLLSWLLAFGPVVKVGIEGTGSYGAGPACSGTCISSTYRSSK